MLPNFFVAGCQKCATTSLHNYLVQHPDIYLPTQKETKHFVMDDRYNKGISYYEKIFFGNIKDELAVGEVDPDYIYFPEALTRIKAHFDLKSLKFIFIFRNPVERAFSHYLMTYRRGIETKSFEEAINSESKRIATNFFSRMHFSYVDRGFYHRQLLPFIEVLKPEQLMFLLTNDLKNEKDSTLRTCFEFLGVKSNCMRIKSGINHHAATVPKSDFLLNQIVRKQDTLPKKIARLLIPNQDLRHKFRAKILDTNQTKNNKNITLKKKERLYLIESFKEENRKLAKLIERDLSFWNEVA